MPAYEYFDPETGVTTTLIRPVAKRDEPVVLTLRRREVPSRIGLVVGAKPLPTQADVLKNAYYQVEQEQGSRFRSEFSKSKAKRILDNDR